MIPVEVKKISQSKAYTLFHLGNEELEIPIYCAPHVGHSITEDEYKRPLSHTFLDRIFDGFGITVSHIVVIRQSDTIFEAHIFLRQNDHVVQIDARPSDCLPYAIKNSIPIYYKQ